jgi:hypothetical protein
MSVALVTSSDDSADSSEFGILEDWGFVMDGVKSVHIHPSLVSQNLAEYLSFQVARSPHNLLRHTQRIFFHFGRDDGDGLYAALLDLFLALRGRGQALRSRLLGGSKARLAPDHFAALSRYLTEPVEESAVPHTGMSVLTAGLTGILPLVRERKEGTQQGRDALIEAREHIDYFQLDAALQLLETAVLADPQRDDLQQELLALYLATNNMEGLRKTRQRLAEFLDPLPEQWLAFDDQQDGAESP